MPNRFTPELRDEYQQLFDKCAIRPEHAGEVQKPANTIALNRARYESVGNPLDIPWYFIGIVHCMECGLSFNKHLHNGDPLTARTVQVPKGRPKTGQPPFTWEESATDALTFDGLHKVTDWSLPAMLFRLEGFNGFGYRKLNLRIFSPYLWSFSNNYEKGKFIKDGVFSANAVSKQCGAAVILKHMVLNGTAELAAEAPVPVLT